MGRGGEGRGRKSGFPGYYHSREKQRLTGQQVSRVLQRKLFDRVY